MSNELIDNEDFWESIEGVPPKELASFKEFLDAAIHQYLKDNLSIELSTEEVYNGGFGRGGRMYDNRLTVKLILRGEVIGVS